MYKITQTSNFHRSFKNYKHNEKVVARLAELIDFLIHEKNVPKEYADHGLKGRWNGYRELHILPDILLIYEKDEEERIITLVSIGSHNKLFH